MDQMLQVIAGGEVEAYAEPGRRWPAPENGFSTWSNPVMEDGYRPEMIDVDEDDD